MTGTGGPSLLCAVITTELVINNSLSTDAADC